MNNNLFDHLNQQRKSVADRIEKSFEPDIQKARSGVYVDNAENRRLNRVGQQYGAPKKDDNKSQQQKNVDKVGRDTSAAVMRGEVSDNEDGTSDLAKHAANTDTNILKKVAASEKADKALREAAVAELKNRGEEVPTRDKTPDNFKLKGDKVIDQHKKYKAAEELYRMLVEDETMDVENAKQIVENAELDREQLFSKWKTIMEGQSQLTDDDIREQVDDFFKELGIENPDEDIDPEWEPTTEDKNNAAKGKELRELKEILDTYDKYVEGEIDRTELRQSVEMTELTADEFAAKMMKHLMEEDNLSRDEVKSTIENMYEVAASDWEEDKDE